MSQDPSFVPGFPDIPNFPVSNKKSFNTTGSLNNNSGSLNNNNNCFNTNNIDVTDDRSEILTWLSPLEPNLRHYGIQTLRVENVGDWVLRAEQFRSWRGGHGESQMAAIFCHGNPGVGKTYISSLVIDSLCDEARKGDIAVACFYFDFAVQKEQSAASTLGALLKQVASGSRKIPEEITNAFREHKRAIGGRRLQLAETVKLLGSLSSSRPTLFCLDAMDECAAADRAKVLFSLRDVIKTSPTTRVFLTGRPHIRGEVERYLSGRAAFLFISPRRDDIIQYIHAKLVEDTTPDEMDERLEAEIVKRIPETVAEIFLLVSLNLDAILQETTIHRRRERLRVLANGLSLGDAYGATLRRIKAQGGEKSRLGMASLMWICNSERPLRAEELCQALAVEIGSTFYNPDNISSIRTVLSCCQGLVVVDKEGSTVRLVHYTLQEFLTSHSGLFQSPHAKIAEKCLTYLNSQQVMALSGFGSPDTKDTPFLTYSALYWGTHMKKEPSPRGKKLALKLFSCYERHASVTILLKHITRRYSLSNGLNLGKFTGLHYASMFGLVEVAKALIEMDGVDINGMDDAGTTPLIWASINGHEAVVKLLLGREDVNPDIPGTTSGRTPISLAAENGHEAVVELLLGMKGVNPDRPGTLHGRTLISLAAEQGHGAVVKLLLGRDGVNPDKPETRRGRTPISLAAGNGHESVVKLLLGRADVNPDRPDASRDRTPILWAAKNGHEAVVQLLLGREDVNPDRPQACRGRTPISLAPGNGHDAVLKLFFGREDVKPDMPDANRGRTPVSLAARNGREEVAKMFMGQEDVNPNWEDTEWGQTPISWASRNGHEAVVKLFLGREDVNPDRPDTRWDLTPISWAARNGHEAVVKLLLGREDINPERSSAKWGRTPISWAAGNGHVAVVKLFLGREDINPDRSGANWGRTPISWAAGNGYEAVVKLLLDREDVNPDKPDASWDRTPISWAAENGHEAVVKLFLGREDVNPDKPDTLSGQTPISLAARNGYEAVVKLFLGRDDVNAHRPDTRQGRTPISWAAQNGHQAVVKLFMGREDGDLGRPGVPCLTVLSDHAGL